MKLHFNPSPLLFGTALFVTLFSSCSKDGVQNASLLNGAQEQPGGIQSVNTDESSLSQENLIWKLVIHPGPDNGQDVYADRWATTGSGNQNYVPELPVNSWDYAGGVTTRSFIKFPQLKRIPVTAQVISAKLYLYTAEHFLNHPQGNTGDNRCAVQRIIGHNWKESTLTWNNQPTATTDDEAIIPASNQATQQFDYNPVVDVTALVKQMVAHSETNFGFRLKIFNEVPNAAVNFASSEAESPSSRPKLIVNYR